MSFQSFQLIEKPISFAVGLGGSAFFGSPVVLEDVLEFFLAFLGASMIAKLRQFPDNNS